MAERGGTALADPAGNGARRTAVEGARSRPSPPKRSGPVPARVKAKLPELVLGIFLVAGGALGAVLWATHEPTQRMLVATRDIRRGESFDESMLRWASLSGEHLAVVDQPAALTDGIAAVDIRAGSPLLTSSVRAPTVIGATQVEYGMALDPGDFPVGLAAGDHVMVVVVLPVDETGQRLEPLTLTTVAEVLAAPGPELAPGEKAVVNLLVERADLALLAGAADLHIGRVEQPVEASAGPDPPEATGAIGAIRDAGGP